MVRGKAPSVGHRNTNQGNSKENNKLKDIAGRPIELESENKRLTTEISRIKQENKIINCYNYMLSIFFFFVEITRFSMF